MDDQQLGELIGTVREIKKSTDKIPDMAVMMAVHESRINSIENRGKFTLATITALVVGVVSSLFRGH